MGGENGYRNRTGRPAWVERYQEQEKVGAGVSRDISREMRAKRLHWLGVCRINGYSTWGRVPIWFGTYNIRNGRNGGLDLALRGVSQANLDLVIFYDTKLAGGVYTRGSAGYSVVTTDALKQHRGRVVVFYRRQCGI